MNKKDTEEMIIIPERKFTIKEFKDLNFYNGVFAASYGIGVGALLYSIIFTNSVYVKAISLTCFGIALFTFYFSNKIVKTEKARNKLK